MDLITITFADIPAPIYLAVVVIVIIFLPRIIRAWNDKKSDGDIWEFANRTARAQAGLERQVKERASADDKAHADISRRLDKMECTIADAAKCVNEMRGEMRAHFNGKKE